MSDTISCTACGSLLRRVAAMTPGTAIQCPRCNTVFTAPELGGAAPAGITTQPTDAPPPRIATLDDQGVTDRPITRPGGPWRVDLGRWMNIATHHWGRVMGPYAGFFLVCALWLVPLFIASALLPILARNNFAGVFVFGRPNYELMQTFQLLKMFVFDPLLGLLALLSLSGGVLVAIRQLTRQRWAFADFFLGFTKFQPLFGWWLLNQVFSVVVGGPILILAFVWERSRPGPVLVWFALLVAAYVLVAGFVYLYFTLRWSFTICLIFDRDLGLFEAMATSWRLTRGHALGLFGAYIVFGLIALIGAMMCYVGLLFAGSLLTLLHAAAYLDATADRPYLRGEED
jgi:hypothetical protein